jgi:flavin-binding protein dodecin
VLERAPVPTTEVDMSVAKVIEIISGSKIGFDDAIKRGIARASDSVTKVTGAWVQDQTVVVENGKIVEYRVAMKITFVINDKTKTGKKK